MITFVTWKWSTPGYRSTFGPNAVNTMRRMLARHYPEPHRFCCVTNDAKGIDADIEIVPDREDWASVPSPHGNGNPTCFRRLRLFAPDARETFGDRVVSIDLDCVITGDLRPLFDRGEDFVAWQDAMHPRQMNGSLWKLRTGAHPEVWEQFNRNAPVKALAAGFVGSDQGWISYCLQGTPRWTREDGVLSFRVDCKNGLPAGARLVAMHGKTDPWSVGVPAWIAEHYR